MYHMQNSVTDWPRAVAQLPDGALVKVIDRGDILRDVKAINPNITTALRHYGGPQNIFDGRGFEAYKDLARQFFATFIDGTFREQYARYTDIVVEWNEYLASSHTGQELQDRIDWARAAAWVWHNEYRTQADYAHIRLALLSCPVGNDIHRTFAEIALQYDCVLSYHAYDKFIGDHQRDPHSWRYHCGRWQYMEESWGLKPDWMFGEAGPYAGVLEGWRHPLVLNGDAGAYVDAVRTWIREIKNTTAYREGRVLGFNLFTTGGTSEWQYYETRQPELDALAAMIRQEWTPPPPVVIAPPPPPDNIPLPSRIIDYVDQLPVNTDSPDWPYETRPLDGVTDVIIHHSVGLPTNPPESIAIGHNNRGWPGIGYHFYIMGNGFIYKTNHLTTHSYHAGTANRTSIGVCLAGDFTNVHPSPEQLDSARFLIQWLAGIVPGAALTKHRDFMATACPGATWSEWWPALTEEPEPPRQWSKLVYLLPQQATREQYAAVADIAYPTRSEIAFSADSAFARPGNVTGQRVIVYDVDAWGGRQALEDWIAAHYTYSPATVVEYRAWPGAEPQEFDFLVWPTTERRVTQRFGVNRHLYEPYGLPGHEGLDLASPLGSPYYCVFPGTVIWASNRRRSDGALSAYGWHVIVDHGDGYTTLYAHAQSTLPVFVGDVLEAGDVVAYSGNTGNSSGAHLHITIKKEGYQLPGWPAGYMDPTPFIMKFNPRWP